MTTARLKIDAIEVHNSDGALITNYAVTTGSGAAYAFVAPEPGSFALVMAVLIAMVVVRRKFNQRIKVNSAAETAVSRGNEGLTQFWGHLRFPAP